MAMRRLRAPLEGAMNDPAQPPENAQVRFKGNAEARVRATDSIWFDEAVFTDRKAMFDFVAECVKAANKMGLDGKKAVNLKTLREEINHDGKPRYVAQIMHEAGHRSAFVEGWNARGRLNTKLGKRFDKAYAAGARWAFKMAFAWIVKLLKSAGQPIPVAPPWHRFVPEAWPVPQKIVSSERQSGLHRAFDIIREEIAQRGGPPLQNAPEPMIARVDAMRDFIPHPGEGFVGSLPGQYEDSRLTIITSGLRGFRRGVRAFLLFWLILGASCVFLMI